MELFGLLLAVPVTFATSLVYTALILAVKGSVNENVI
jgi:hypothetical protein